MNIREACSVIMGDNLARSIIADMGIHWAVVAAMSEATTKDDPAALQTIRTWVAQNKPEPPEAHQWLSNATAKLRLLTVFLLYTGCRVTEACDLRGECISRRHRQAYIGETKNAEPRAVHLPPPVMAELAGVELKAGERVFGYDDRWAVYRDWAPLRKELGFPVWWTPHACCHTWATWMRRFAGNDLRGLLGTGRWKDIKSVLVYQHADTTEESRTADKLPDVRNPWSWRRKRTKSTA